ncbi:hypothetical protein EG68_00413 [Paragonimus skrjabini miyazakii]|uniref:GPI-GlcNAc transferase complex PIG-H component conserved domain-containing protein n=1 Tax=Paragonimus skrjabini miyazakii TaxID=59628 RepID=A0A8S9Z449_9TREM|nr:hypothetical protein EG68_00413 [Paragonimus skrjabini miyazakii]
MNRCKTRKVSLVCICWQLSLNELSLVGIQIAVWLLSLDPHFPRESSEKVHEMQAFHPPRWIQVKLKRLPSTSKWIVLFLVGVTPIWLLGTLFQSNVIPLLATLVFALFLYIRLRNVIVEESVLVVCGFGIQTQQRFITGNQLFSTFIPLSRLRSVLLVDRVTPMTIIPFLAAELSAMRLSSEVCGSQDPPSLQNELFPLLPSSLTEDGQNFLGSLCLPFPTLVFVFRLIHAVCSR